MTDFVKGNKASSIGHLIAVFDVNKKIQERKHGLTSHAIKHFGEFNPATVRNYITKAIKIAKNSPRVFILNSKGEIVAEGNKAKVMLQYRVMLNTFDMINDRAKNAEKLNETEEKINKLIIQMKLDYKHMIEHLMKSAIDIDKMPTNNIEKLIERKIPVTFMGQRDSNTNRFYFDPKTTAYITASPDGTKVITMFQTKRPFKETLQSRNIYVFNDNLRKAVFGKNVKTLRQIIREELKNVLFEKVDIKNEFIKILKKARIDLSKIKIIHRPATGMIDVYSTDPSLYGGPQMKGGGRGTLLITSFFDDDIGKDEIQYIKDYVEGKL